MYHKSPDQIPTLWVSAASPTRRSLNGIDLEFKCDGRKNLESEQQTSDVGLQMCRR